MHRNQRYRMWTLLHVTLAENVASIRKMGLLVSYSETAKQEIWLCTPQRLWWALRHIADRYGVRVSDMVVLRVMMYRRELRRRRRGIWITLNDVSPTRIA